MLKFVALTISSCGKLGGDDEGKGGVGDNPYGTQTNLKRILKLNTASEDLKVQSIDFDSQQRIPIVLDLSTIKEATGKYKVTIKARVLASRNFPKGADITDKISYGFGVAGKDKFVILEKGVKENEILRYQVNNSVGDYLELQIEFYVSYKNDLENKQDEVNPVVLIAERNIKIQNKPDSHTFLHSEMGKQQSFKVFYSSSITDDVLKGLPYVFNT